MSARTVPDAAILGVLAGFPNEANIRLLSKKWSVADFDFAFETYPNITLLEYRVYWHQLIALLRNERLIEEYHLGAEQAAERRHTAVADSNAVHQTQIVQNLIELRKPHWILWLTLGITGPV